ncbi:MAG: helix-turn-helix domain-containing protein [Steroidobacteraceae bacterium]|jgi:IclR family mhp operon transcriptional activator
MHFNRSLGRGLKILAILNAGGEHRVASLARDVKLPRSTAFRLLCTLVEEGYVRRDPATDIYHPTALVMALSDGFDATARLVQVARPQVTALGKQLVWPVMLATLSGTSVLLRQTTDSTSPLAVVRYTAGYRAPVLDRASGQVLLAFSSKHQRQMVLDLLYRDDAAKDQPIARSEIESRLAEIRALGYACMHGPRHASARNSLAVPVQAGEDTLAVLVVRFARSAVRQQTVMEQFLPALRGAAHAIVEAFHRPGAQPAESPGAQRDGKIRSLT